jgi:hypothetical protein
VNEPDTNHAELQAPVEVPAPSAETIAAQDALFDKVDALVDLWWAARDSLCDELERREGRPLQPGLDGALDALRKLGPAEREARSEFASVLATLSRSER